jgi:hypothetical protein
MASPVAGDSPAARRARDEYLRRSLGAVLWSMQTTIERDRDAPERTPEEQARHDADNARQRAELLEKYPELRSRSFRRRVVRVHNFAALFTRTPVMRPRRTCSGSGRPAARRTSSSRAGPDPDPDEPEPPPGGFTSRRGAVA